MCYTQSCQCHVTVGCWQWSSDRLPVTVASGRCISGPRTQLFTTHFPGDLDLGCPSQPSWICSKYCIYAVYCQYLAQDSTRAAAGSSRAAVRQPGQHTETVLEQHNQPSGSAAGVPRLFRSSRNSCLAAHRASRECLGAAETAVWQWQSLSGTGNPSVWQSKHCLAVDLPTCQMPNCQLPIAECRLAASSIAELPIAE